MGIIVPILGLKPNYEFPTEKTERYIDDIRKRIGEKFAQMQVEIDEQDEERARHLWVRVRVRIRPRLGLGQAARKR